MGRSRGYGFVYMQNSEGAQAVQDYATKNGYRVEMYGRKNIQLHKHMNDRMKRFSRNPTSTIRPTRDSTRSTLYPDNTLNSFYPEFNTSNLSLVYPSHPHFIYPDAQGSPSMYTGSGMHTVDSDHSLHSLTYYYTAPMMIPTPQGTLNVYSTNPVVYNAAYSIPSMYAMSEEHSTNHTTKTIPSNPPKE